MMERYPRVTLAEVGAHPGLSTTAVALILNGKTGTGLSEDAHRRVFGRAEQERAIEALLDRGVDALVIATVTGRTALPERRPAVPVVLLNGTSPNKPYASVLPDEAEGGRQAAEHLITLGHRRVHLLGMPPRLYDHPLLTPQVQRRIEGLLNAFRAAGVDVVPIPYKREAWDAETGFETASRALRDAAPVGAVVALNDAFAAGAYEAFRSAGLKIPQDVSVVSFDDDDIVSLLRPRLNTVALPFEAMGRRSVELALEAAAPGEYLEAMELRVRESARPVA